MDAAKMEQGEHCLKKAIETAKIAGDNAVFIRAVICYGDLLSETGRLEPAAEWLKLALEEAASMNLDTEVLNFELGRARVILAQLEAK
ncbi:hypothetical protein [Paenibacillus sp. GCM10012306]|uniref:hypothetical protein n=1 Tax=Paenibacillus sp. GCM10012306 TaxID=3317342 RepID=UPI0036D3BF70